MTIKFQEIGDSLGTRFLGAQVRARIEEAIRQQELVVFELKGVEVISHSFADECFGKLLLTWTLADLKTKTTFQNVDPMVKKTIALTFRERHLANYSTINQ